MLGRLLVASSALALVAVACSSEPTTAPVTIDEYAEAMQAVESRFAAAAPDPEGQPEDRNRYPLGGDLVFANDLYTILEERLSGWRAITPPPSVAEFHDRLVDALDAVQHEVGEYLGSEAMTGTDFDFDTIGAAVAPFLRQAATACRDLHSALRDARADVAFVGDCNF